MYSVVEKGPRGEPPTKKPRLGHQPDLLLPSPKTTLTGSTDSFASPSSSISLPKTKTARSFRDRLFPPTKNAPKSAARNPPSQQREDHPKTSIAPIFRKKIEAAFQDESSDPIHTSHEQRKRASSPESDPEEIFKQLKEHYLDTADNLYDRATMHLEQIHSKLLAKLGDTVKAEDSFLTVMEKQNKTLCAPLSQFTIRSEQRDSVNGTVHINKETVGNLVSGAETQLKEFEADISRLWKEWETAEAEVESVFREIIPDEKGQQGSGETARLVETMTKLRAAIEKEISKAQEDVNELGSAAVTMLKQIEKDFRQITVPDILIYFQSIDE
ncbi:hypothetical protein B0T25DRAFT_531876 [Lasiosphaeria hispida]|uniref:Uncharacterized protein n=1 Tax=Lasiosphaeria hispida TaxID=260671 RepID=A0AAJ0HPY1_9PEZI|nr:hypothetical protein B0T25DRAFT_531876 [Lasiosphaeria hispida]